MTGLPAPFRAGVLAALLIVPVAVAGCGDESRAEPAARGQPAVRVTLRPVVDSVVRRPIRATGVLGAKEEIPLGFKIGGVIARIAVESGDRVRAGQLLAQLEPREIDAEVARAEAARDQAERDLARATALYRDSVIARDRLEAAETGAAVARAGLAIARFNRDYAVIRAPQAGVILRRLAEPGQQIATGSPVLVLAGASRGQVIRVGLADRDAARVAVGDPAAIRFAARPGPPLAGRVTEVAAAASPGSGAWSVEVGLQVPLPMASGLIGEVEIDPVRATEVRLIPLAAVLEGDGDSAVVYTVPPGARREARRQRVTVAFLAGDRAAILGGLAGVDSVVTAGAAYLADGTPVAVVSAPPAGGTP